MIQLKKNNDISNLAKEQLMQFLLDNQSVDFTFRDFKLWQDKMFKAGKIHVIIAWWAIFDELKKLKHTLKIYEDKEYISSKWILEELNRDCKDDPEFFYDEEKKEYYQLTNEVLYTVEKSDDK